MLAKNQRLRNKKEFEQVSKKGKTSTGDFLVLKKIKNNLKYTRVGFVVSQKITKKAVLRNKIKRRLREAYRISLAQIKPGYDLAFLAKKGIEEKSFWEIKEEVEKLLQKAKILKRDQEIKRSSLWLKSSS